MLAIYVALIVGDGTHSFLEALPWATLMAVPAVAANQIKDRRIAGKLRVTAAVLFPVLVGRS